MSVEDYFTDFPATIYREMKKRTTISCCKMAKTQGFDRYAEQYDMWFEKNRELFLSEVKALHHFMPEGRGIEIGLGTGRFACQLGVKIGVEPSVAMGMIAQKRGIYVISGIAEELPVLPEVFDFAIFVTVLCFVNSIDRAFGEVYRILKSEGSVLIGMIDGGSVLGQEYQRRKDNSPFYKDAVFQNVETVCRKLRAANFVEVQCVQTLFSEKGGDIEPEHCREGYGEGSFVVISAKKSIVVGEV